VSAAATCPAGLAAGYCTNMNQIASLVNHFLIAMPRLADPNFSRTVTLLCDHSAEGAMGLVINRPTDLKLRDVYQQLEISAAGPEAEQAVFLGGPVQNNRGFVLHEPLGHWEATLPVTDTLGVSTSRDILNAISRHEGPDHYLVTLGYAGWGPGQLENELTDNGWLTLPAEDDVIFNTPDHIKWKVAAKRYGIDITTYGDVVGSA